MVKNATNGWSQLNHRLVGKDHIMKSPLAIQPSSLCFTVLSADSIVFFSLSGLYFSCKFVDKSFTLVVL